MIELIENIGWQNSAKFWHLALLFILLMLGLYWEVNKQKPRISSRIIALVLVFISLYIIYLSPYILREKSQKSVLLISQNVSQNIVDSLKSEYDLTILQQLENSKFRQEDGDGQNASLAELDFQIDTAFVYGYFPQLDPSDYLVRRDIEVKEGLRFQAPNSISYGDSLKIRIENLDKRSISISATIGNDSISKTIPANGYSNISILPKAAGYIFVEIASGGSDYNIAVRVEDSEHYVFQILSAAPDFEWKFLGDYLKSKEHSVYQKTQISKGKFKSSFFNWHDSLQIKRGVANDLKVLFADSKAWEDLAINIKNRYLRKLKENRGSLIFRSNPNTQVRIDLDKSKPTNIFSTSDNLLESNNHKYLQFNNIYDLDEVLKNDVFRKVDFDMIYGVINFQDSYRLKLAGKNQEYENLWRPVFSKLIRNSAAYFYDKSEWAVQHQPFFFRLWSVESEDEISIINLNSDTIKIKSKPDLFYSERQHFMFYPKSVGWHFIQIQDQTEAIPFYVHPSTQAIQPEFLYNYNHDYLNYRNFVYSSIQYNGEKYNEDSVTIWVFMLFLFSVGYLWIEDKIT